jgi:adenine-specific DNA-methyltransferase
MMPRRNAAVKNATKKKPIEQYDHKGKKRTNNPPVGLVTPENDQDKPAKKYAYDPHLDPQLVWAGKAERTSFEVPTVSLHVHERIDPRTIIEAVRKRNGNGHPTQGFLFERPDENLPFRDAIDFYRHPHNWSNRLIAGDSLLVMNSLLEKEGMAGQVQMVYIDPPYGIKYGSNFQPFVNRRDVKDGKDEDLTQEPEMVRAFRDTWELGIHSYLSYLRDRLWLAKELLHESGSCFVQINDENVHRVRDLLDEVMLARNFVSIVTFSKTTGASSELLPMTTDYILWYAREISRIKYRPLYLEKALGGAGASGYTRVELQDGSRRFLGTEEKADQSLVPPGSRVFALDNMTSQRPPGDFPVTLGEQTFRPRKGYWKTGEDGMEKLKAAKRLEPSGDYIRYVRYLNDFPVFPLTNIWSDTSVAGFTSEKVYAVQTTPKVIQRCLLLTTDPGDLVFDPTCGSGTTAYVAEQWGRRWITCDTSRVAVTLARQRLMTAVYNYYRLRHPEEGVVSGFNYETVPHVTLKCIANNPEIREGMTRAQIDAAVAKYAEQEDLYDQPFVDKSRARVSGPFTVEAVPAPTVKSISEIGTAGKDMEASQINLDGSTPPRQVRLAEPPVEADASIARSGPTLRHAEWRDELLKTGIRGKGGQTVQFSRVEPLTGTRWIHADAETKGLEPERVAVAFGPEDAPLDQRQVEMAWEEARTLRPRPRIIVFASFQFDPEAAKDIDESTPEKTGMTFLKVQMNADLLTEDLKKKRASNQSFWLVGQPDVELRSIKTGEHKGKYQVEVHGFDYYNTKTGIVESGDTVNIAMWLLDTDYDGRSLYPRQVFFPIADADGGWARLARNLKAEIDPDLVEAYRGTVSLPFEPGNHKRVAVKIVDDRGIESLKVVDL